MPDIAIRDARIHYVDEGSGPETIVFAHGLLWSGEMFRPQIDALSGRYRCIAFDFRGQGRSAVTRSGYDMDTLADDTRALIEQLGAAPCHFVGLSMGGFIGMRLAARHPRLIASLALLATAADREPRANVPKYTLLSAVARTVGLGRVVKPVMKVMFGATFLADPAREAEREARRRDLSSVDRVGAVRATWAVITRLPIEDELARITAPTLVLSGEGERAVVPARSRRTAERIPGARFQLLPRAGHTSTLEEPAAVITALLDFYASLPSRAAGVSAAGGAAGSTSLDAAAIIDGAVAGALAPLDAARGALLGFAGRAWRDPLRRRDLRVALGGSLGVGASLVLAVLAPLWLLTLGPLLLGVPHLLSDVRYLVVRPALHRRRWFLPLVALPLVVSLVLPGLPVALLAVAGALVLARASVAMRLCGVALVLALAVAARAGGHTVDVVFAHAHNAIAIGLWWWWRPHRPRWQLAPVIGSVVGVALLLASGDTLAARFASLAPPGAGLDHDTLARALSPIEDPAWSLRLVLAFAFAQSVHYGVWLRLIPDDERPRPGLRSFRSTYRALVQDCGRPLVLGALVLAAVLMAWGLADLEAARTGYLRLALFHGPLELAVIGLLVVERRGPGARAVTAAPTTRAAG